MATAFAAMSLPDEDEHESEWSAWSRTVDHWTIGACLALYAIGVVLAFASSPALAERTDVEVFHYAWRHMVIGAPAFIVLLCLSFLGPRGVRRFGVFLAAAGLVAVALTPIYGEAHGKQAYRWFSVAGISVQPSEFLKPGVIIVCGWCLSGLAQSERSLRMSAVVAALFLVSLAVWLLVRQPDYGQSALLVAAFAAMFYAAGGSLWALICVGLAGLIVGWIGYAFEPHIAARIDAFLDPVGAGQTQLRHAAEAIANGGWFGVGLGEGVAKTVLPDAHSDFILAVAAEEYGFALVSLIVLLYTAIALRAVWRLQRSEDAFVFVTGVGLAALFGLQAMIHVAVTAQVAPPTGMTLPLISYGGSCMLATCAGVGLLLAPTRRNGVRG